MLAKGGLELRTETGSVVPGSRHNAWFEVNVSLSGDFSANLLETFEGIKAPPGGGTIVLMMWINRLHGIKEVDTTTVSPFADLDTVTIQVQGKYTRGRARATVLEYTAGERLQWESQFRKITNSLKSRFPSGT